MIDIITLVLFGAASIHLLWRTNTMYATYRQLDTDDRLNSRDLRRPQQTMMTAVGLWQLTIAVVLATLQLWFGAVAVAGAGVFCIASRRLFASA